MLATRAPIFSTIRETPRSTRDTHPVRQRRKEPRRPWKQIRIANSVPDCSLPAMGCPARNRVRCLAESLCRPRHHLRLPCSPHPSAKSLRRSAGPSPSIRSITPPQASRARPRHCRVRRPPGLVCPTSIAPSPVARSSTSARSHPTIRPINLCFLKGESQRPPISPVANDGDLSNGHEYWLRTRSRPDRLTD